MGRFFLLAMVVGMLASCGTTTNDPNNVDLRYVFRYNESGGVSSLDPAMSSNVENIWAISQVFNGLVQLDDSLDVVPCIAKSWEVSEDGMEYTFQLRNDVYFHDHELFPDGKGRKVVANDFVQSFFRIINPDVMSPGSYLLNNIDRTERSNYLGFTALNDSVFKIFLDRPFPPFLRILSMQYFSVVPHEVVSHYGSDFRRNPVGTGPFKFKVWKEGVKLVLEKNLNYFEVEDGVRLPYLDAVSISFVKDRQLSFLDFTRGKFDMISGVAGSFKDLALTSEGDLRPEYKGKVVLRKTPYLKTDYLGILLDADSDVGRASGLSHHLVRQAVNHALDRQALISYIRNGVGVAAQSGFIPKGMPGFQDSLMYSYNPGLARELLVEAGFPQGKGLNPIVLSTTSHYQEICEIIQHQLGEVGLNVKISGKDEATFRQLVANGREQFFTKSWVADYADAENFMSLFYSENFAPSGPNYTHYKSQEFDSLYHLSLTVTNEQMRQKLYKQMNSILVRDLPVIPLYYDEIVRFLNPEVKGMGSNPMNALDLKKVRKTL